MVVKRRSSTLLVGGVVPSLFRCLQSIQNLDSGIISKIVVHDNASEDNIDHLDSDFPQVIVTKNSHNIGFARAVNEGLAKSAAPNDWRVG